MGIPSICGKLQNNRPKRNWRTVPATRVRRTVSKAAITPTGPVQDESGFRSRLLIRHRWTSIRQRICKTSRPKQQGQQVRELESGNGHGVRPGKLTKYMRYLRNLQAFGE